MDALKCVRDTVLFRRAPPDPACSTQMLFVETQGFADMMLRTVSYLEPDEKTMDTPVVNTIRANVLACIRKNPWLMGSFKKAGGCFRVGQTMYLAWPSEAHLFDERTVDGIVHCIDVAAGEIPPFENYFGIETYITDLIGKYNRKSKASKRLFNVYVIRIANGGDAPPSYKVVVSMCHAIGDGYTFYTVQGMVLGGRSIIGLDPVRRMIVDEDIEYQGRFFPRKAKDGKPKFPFSSLPGFAWAKSKEWTTRVVRRRAKWGANLKSGAGMYHVDEDEVKDRVDRLAPLAPKGSWVSTNDVVTSWFWSKLPDVYIRLMAIDMRGRLPEITQGLAGNYIATSILYSKDCGIDPADPLTIRRTLVANRSLSTARAPRWGQCFECMNIASNWSTFQTFAGIPGYTETFHLPVVNPTDFNGNVCIIFRSTPGQRSVLVWGDVHNSKLSFDPKYDPVLLERCNKFGMRRQDN